MSNLKALFDPIRQKEVIAQPEERIRIDFIHEMLRLGYPSALIRVEVDLSQSTLLGKKAPNRRLDIVCYQKAPEGFVPLLLVECKAGKLSQKAEQQAVGYNYYLGSPFVCLVGEDEIKFGKDTLEKVDELPTYSELIQKQEI